MNAKEKQKAFTLVELLVAMAIGLVVIAGLSSTFISQRKTYNVQEQISEMLQNGRAAMGIMSNEIRMTGYGVTTTALPWIDWAGVTFTTIPVVIEEGAGALGSDIIHIAGCFDGAAATLSSNASAGDTTINVTPVDSSKSVSDLFDTDDEKVICINGLENAVVTGISGNTLTIDTDPSNNQGLLNAAANTLDVCVVKVISYSVVQDADGSYILKRNENLGAGRQPLAENITDLQTSLSGNTIEINPLTARTDKRDPDYIPNGGYRTKDLRSFITPPNLLINGVGSATTTTATTTTGTTSTTSTSSTTTPSTTTASTTAPTTSTTSTSTSTSTTTSSTTSTSTTTSTTTTTLGGSCELAVTLVANFADSSSHSPVTVSVTVMDGSTPVEDATVEWSINSDSQGVLTHVGSGHYEATSSNTYQKNSEPSVGATASKSGCLSGSGGPITLPK